MKIMSYKYNDKLSSMPQFLYVDAEYDSDSFPLNVREIIEKAEQMNPVGIDVIQRMGKNAAERFVAQHYLDSVVDIIEH